MNTPNWEAFYDGSYETYTRNFTPPVEDRVYSYPPEGLYEKKAKRLLEQNYNAAMETYNSDVPLPLSLRIYGYEWLLTDPELMKTAHIDPSDIEHIIDCGYRLEEYFKAGAWKPFCKQAEIWLSLIDGIIPYYVRDIMEERIMFDRGHYIKNFYCPPLAMPEWYKDVLDRRKREHAEFIATVQSV